MTNSSEKQPSSSNTRPQSIVDLQSPPGSAYPSSKQRQEAAVRYATVQGIKGALWGFTISTSITALLHYTWPVYRSITLPGKAMWIATATLGTAIVTSEHAIYYFNHPRTINAEDNQPWAISNFLMRYKWQSVAGVLGGGLVAAILIVGRNPHLTATQKFLNARLWAQGIGLGTAMLAIGIGSQKGSTK